jgi:predicted component of type VI protein secretion system
MEATFIIVREDLQVDRVTIVAEGVLIGRLPICELLLNHPSVSRLQAGISYVDGNYYLRNLRQGNPIMVNGAKLEEYEALADGDVVGIGPFALNIGFAQGVLIVKVSLQIAASPADAIARRDASGVWDLPTTAQLQMPSETVPAAVEGAAHQRKVPARSFLGQANYGSDENGQTISAFSSIRPAQRQSAIDMGSHH